MFAMPQDIQQEKHAGPHITQDGPEVFPLICLTLFPLHVVFCLESTVTYTVCLMGSESDQAIKENASAC